MLSFKYTARDPNTGQYVKATVEAETEAAAAQLIRKEGMVPVDIALADKAKSGVLGKFTNKVKIKDKVLFSRQLSTLINAGLPLVQSLRSVQNQTANKAFRLVIAKVISDVEAGTTLSAAMEKHPQVFNRIYTSLIAAGETSGTLDRSLERLAVQQEKDADLISKVRGAMVYPLVVTGVMVAVVAFMLVSVLPQVKGLYEGMPGAKLPLITSVLMAISDFIIGFWWLILLLMGIGVFFTTRWARTGPGKEVVDKAKMKMWPIGDLFMKMYMARFARTATTLVASGVPLIQVLDITAAAVNNVHVERSIKNAEEKVRGGRALSEALQNDTNFLPLVPNMMRIGEESGALEQMLGKVADYFEKEVDDAVKSISTIIEPVLMIMLGIVAFTIVAAVLLPIYGLAGQNMGM